MNRHSPARLLLVIAAGINLHQLCLDVCETPVGPLGYEHPGAFADSFSERASRTNGRAGQPPNGADAQRTTTLEEEVAFFNRRLGASRTLVELLSLRRHYRRSFAFVIRCLPTLARLHLQTARDNRLQRAA